MTNLEHALNILQGVIDKHKADNQPVGQLTLVKSYIITEMEKDSAIKLDTSVDVCPDGEICFYDGCRNGVCRRGQ